jgi:hypothetical protein
MNDDDENKIADDVSEPAGRPTPNYDNDPNVQARKRAGRRAANFKSGLDTEDGIAELEDKTGIEKMDGFADGGEVPPLEDGGIVAEAEKELDVVSEADVENPEEQEKNETEAEAEAEAEPAEMPEEAEEAETSEEPETAIEKFAEEESKEPQHQQKVMPVGEYQAPEGESHDELIDKYHEALAFGDIEQAKDLYKQLQEHRFAENTHRAKSEAQAEQEAQAYVDVAQSMVAAHPELGEDGLAANKVLALSDVYRQEGMSAVEALQKAVADLYPEAPVESAPAPVAEAAVEPPVEGPKEETPAMEVQPDTSKAESMIPDMEDRMAQKRNIVTLPNASARKEETPPPKQPSRSDAIQMMKEKRGQA